MIHYLINTGFTHETSIDDLRPETLEFARQNLRDAEVPVIDGKCVLNINVLGDVALYGMISGWSNGTLMPLQGFTVVTQERFADCVWKAVEKGYMDICDQAPFRSFDFAAPHQPASAPWSVRTVYLAIHEVDPTAYFSDAECHFAHAFYEKAVIG